MPIDTLHEVTTFSRRRGVGGKTDGHSNSAGLEFWENNDD